MAALTFPQITMECRITSTVQFWALLDFSSSSSSLGVRVVIFLKYVEQEFLTRKSCFGKLVPNKVSQNALFDCG